MPIAFIIVRNGNYEALTEFVRRFNLPGTQLPGLDFCGLAQSQSVPGVRVERIEELAPALHAAFQSSKPPMLVEVLVSPSG